LIWWRAGIVGVGVNGIVFAVVVLPTSIVLVAALAWVSRRLLGLPVGALRALIAGLVRFVAAIRGTQPVPVDPWDAVATAAVLDAARTSARTGQVVRPARTT